MTMSRRDFEAVAAAIRESVTALGDRERVARRMADRLEPLAPRFDRLLFIEAAVTCGDCGEVGAPARPGDEPGRLRDGRCVACHPLCFADWADPASAVVG